MADIVGRLRFDAARCEMQFSKGVAGNITEAADEIERLLADSVDKARAWDEIAKKNAMIERLLAALKEIAENSHDIEACACTRDAIRRHEQKAGDSK